VAMRGTVGATGKRVEKPMRVVVGALVKVVIRAQSGRMKSTRRELIEQLRIEELNRAGHRQTVNPAKRPR
jgi:hypothetical protein